MQEGDAFGLTRHHLEVRHRAYRGRLLRRHVPGEVETARQDLGELSLLIRYETKLKLGPFRVGLRTVGEVIRIALHANELAARMFDDPERPGADRLLGHGRRSSPGRIGVGLAE